MKKSKLAISFALLAGAAGAGAALCRKMKTDKSFRRDADAMVGKGIMGAVGMLAEMPAPDAVPRRRIYNAIDWLMTFCPVSLQCRLRFTPTTWSITGR